MQLPVVKAQGAGSQASLDVSERVFGAPYNESLVHQVVTAYMAGARAGTRAHKSRAQVSGGNSKPWRQKGTGRARAGSSRSPLWRGGGKTFASAPTDHAQKVNRKMYRGAMRAILSELVRQQRLLVVEQLAVSAPKTRELVSHLGGMGLKDVLLVTEALDETLMLAGRNLHWVGVQQSADVSPLSLLAFEKVLCTVPALKRIEERVA